MQPTDKTHSAINSAEGSLQDRALNPLAHSSLPVLLTAQERRTYFYERELEGHKAPVLAMCGLPDGGTITGSADSTLIVRTPDGKPTRLEGHQGPVNCVTVTPDGRIVSASADGTVRVWSAQEGRTPWESHVLRGHAGGVTCLLALSPGKLVSGASDGSVRLWTEQDGHTWSCQTLLGHTGSVRCVDQLPNGNLVTGSDDGTARMWRLSHPMSEGSVALAHGAKVHGVKALPNGDVVVVGPDLATRWGLNSEGQPCACARLEGLQDARVLPDGHVVALVGPDSLSVWGCSDGQRWEKTASWDREWRTFSGITPMPCGRIIVRVTFMDEGNLHRELEIIRVSPVGKLSFEGHFWRAFAESEAGSLAVGDGRFAIANNDGSVFLHGVRSVRSGQRAVMAQRYFSQAWSKGQ